MGFQKKSSRWLVVFVFPCLVLLIFACSRVAAQPVDDIPLETAISQLYVYATQTVFAVERGGPVADLAYSPDGMILAVAYGDGSIKLWSVDGDILLQVLTDEPASAATRILFSPDGRILAAGYQDGTTRLWSVPDGVLMRLLDYQP